MALAERGAEAVVTACEWHGRPAVAKHRNRRSYRHPDLETRLVAERLRAEGRGCRCPRSTRSTPPRRRW